MKKAMIGSRSSIYSGQPRTCGARHGGVPACSVDDRSDERAVHAACDGGVDTRTTHRAVHCGVSTRCVENKGKRAVRDACIAYVPSYVLSPAYRRVGNVT